MINFHNGSARTLASLNAFMFSAAQIMLVALFPFLAEALKLELSSIALIFSLGSLLFLLSGPYWAARSDRSGRRTVLVKGTAGLSISFAILVAIVHFPSSHIMINGAWLVLSRAIYGLVASSVAPVSQALQTDGEPIARVTHSTLRHALSLSLGRACGAGVFILFQRSILTIMTGMLVFMALVFILNLKMKNVEVPYATVEDVRTGWMSEFAQVKWIMGTAFLFTAFAEALNFSVAGVVQHVFRFDTLTTTVLSARVLFFACTGVLAVQVVGRLLTKALARYGMGVGLLSLFAGSLIFIRLESLGELWAALSFMIVGLGIIPPLYFARLRENSAPREFGKRAGLVSSVQTLGYAVGGLIAAISIRVGPLQTGYVLAALVVVLSVTVLRGALK